MKKVFCMMAAFFVLFILCCCGTERNGDWKYSDKLTFGFGGNPDNLSLEDYVNAADSPGDYTVEIYFRYDLLQENPYDDAELSAFLSGIAERGGSQYEFTQACLDKFGMTGCWNKTDLAEKLIMREDFRKMQDVEPLLALEREVLVEKIYMIYGPIAAPT